MNNRERKEAEEAQELFTLVLKLLTTIVSVFLIIYGLSNDAVIEALLGSIGILIVLGTSKIGNKPESIEKRKR